jgi:aminopeptidase N
MEQASGRSLERFFARWIYGSTVPRLNVSYRVAPGGDGNELLLRVEQTSEEVFDLPLSVTIQYADRTEARITVPVTDRVVETAVALKGALRAVEVGRDDGTLAEITND